MRSWKLSVPIALLGMGSSLVTAFPTEAMRNMMAASGHNNGKRCPFGHDSDQVQKRANPDAPIDGMFSQVSYIHACQYTNPGGIVSGEHAFQPPDFKNGDVRGLCPGLNALANHGYLPRSGVVSVSEQCLC